ncbi:ANTAR domain-containing protein [Streptomyces globisporus]
MAAFSSPERVRIEPSARYSPPLRGAARAARVGANSDPGGAWGRVRQLEQALVSHAVIDQACGVLMALSRCTPDQAWKLLVRLSQNSNIKARVVARAIVAYAQGEQLPDVISRCLKNELSQTASAAPSGRAKQP